MAVTSETHRLPVRTLVASSAGNAVEWYDWGIYTAFSIYFATQIFPSGNEAAALLSTFAVVRHTRQNDRPLDNGAEEVVKHVARLWGFRVRLESVDNHERVLQHWEITPQQHNNH